MVVFPRLDHQVAVKNSGLDIPCPGGMTGAYCQGEKWVAG